MTDSTCRPVRRAVGQQLQTLAVEGGAVASVNFGEQSVLATEVVTHERPVHASLGGNDADRDAADSCSANSRSAAARSCSRVSEAGRSGGVHSGARRGVVVTAESYSRIEQSLDSFL